MQPEPEPCRHESARPIPVSELGQWVYCHLAWKLNRLGVVPTAEAEARADAGRAWHEEHGEAVATVDTARRVRNLCVVLAVIVATAGAILWMLQ